MRASHFAGDFAPAISRGERPEAPRARKARMGVTVKDLFQSYVEHLRSEGKGCADKVEHILLTAGTKGAKSAARALGETKRAADVTARDVVSHLKGIYDRGSTAMAYIARAYVGAAFAHAMASENSYTSVAGTVEWVIKVNPVTAIPADKGARRVGQRYLNQAELCDLWNWLVRQDEFSSAAPAARLIIVTGQRVSEILCVSDKVWGPDDKMLDWGKTKNGRPHNVPVPQQGVDILETLEPNRHGLYFPHRDDPKKPSEAAVAQLIDKYLGDHPTVPRFTSRDLRRTWKTLAGAAGISKELRDRIQNHARSDVSSKHYDRYDMLKERREAMDVWSKYLARVIAGEFKEVMVEKYAVST
jgi:integrase